MSDFTVLRNGNEADLDRALAWVRPPRPRSNPAGLFASTELTDHAI